MELSEIIKSYRSEHGLSLREFSKMSGVSNSYLSMLENGRQPRDGKPIVPTLTKLDQIASAMGIRLDDLIKMMDDSPVVVDGNIPESRDLNLSPVERELILKFRQLSAAEQNVVLRSVGIQKPIKERREK